MVELYQKSNDSAALRVLWKETFEIRRLEFEKGKLSSLEEVRKSCPLFSQPIYVTFVLWVICYTQVLHKLFLDKGRDEPNIQERYMPGNTRKMV